MNVHEPVWKPYYTSSSISFGFLHFIFYRFNRFQHELLTELPLCFKHKPYKKEKTAKAVETLTFISVIQGEHHACLEERKHTKITT